MKRTHKGGGENPGGHNVPVAALVRRLRWSFGFVGASMDMEEIMQENSMNNETSKKQLNAEEKEAIREFVIEYAKKWGKSFGISSLAIIFAVTIWFSFTLPEHVANRALNDTKLITQIFEAKEQIGAAKYAVAKLEEETVLSESAIRDKINTIVAELKNLENSMSTLKDSDVIKAGNIIKQINESQNVDEILKNIENIKTVLSGIVEKKDCGNIPTNAAWIEREVSCDNGYMLIAGGCEYSDKVEYMGTNAPTEGRKAWKCTGYKASDRPLQVCAKVLCMPSSLNVP